MKGLNLSLARLSGYEIESFRHFDIENWNPKKKNSAGLVPTVIDFPWRSTRTEKKQKKTLKQTNRDWTIFKKFFFPKIYLFIFFVLNKIWPIQVLSVSDWVFLFCRFWLSNFFFSWKRRERRERNSKDTERERYIFFFEISGEGNGKYVELKKKKKINCRSLISSWPVRFWKLCSKLFQ